MSDDSPLDPTTGLLHRAAFLKEVRESQSKVPGNRRRGCLLILHFPGLLKLAESDSEEAADQTLQLLLAVVESRLRSRDTLGRIARHSLCLLLRQCREKDAIVIADQYVALLNDGVMGQTQHTAMAGLHYRIVPLDPRGRRPRLGLSRVVSSPALGDTAQLLSTISSFAPDAEHTTDNVVSLNNDAVSITGDSNDGTQHPALSVAGPAGPHAQIPHRAWRLKPGLLLNHKLTVCSHRLQSVGAQPVADSLVTSTIVNAALDSLALSADNTRPLIETQLIIPVDATLLTQEAAHWLKDRCQRLRVAPSDICLVVTMDSVSVDIRTCMPVVRQLNRQGIRLMLEGISAAPQLSAILKFGAFDYFWISAKTLQESMHDVRQREELSALVTEAHAQHREVCASGIDTQALLDHAQALKIDIGFGRRCGKSEPFPAISPVSVHPAG